MASVWKSDRFQFESCEWNVSIPNVYFVNIVFVYLLWTDHLFLTAPTKLPNSTEKLGLWSFSPTNNFIWILSYFEQPLVVVFQVLFAAVVQNKVLNQLLSVMISHSYYTNCLICFQARAVAMESTGTARPAKHTQALKKCGHVVLCFYLF